MSWVQNYNKLVSFIEVNNRLPEFHENRALFQFVANNEYKAKNKNPKLWDELRAKHATAFIMNVAKYDATMQPLRDFIDLNKRKPSNAKDERNLLKLWRRFKKRHWYGFYSNADELYDVFKAFVEDARYGSYFGRKTEKWMAKFKEFERFIHDTQSLPSKGWMYKWFKRQVRECKQDNILYTNEIRQTWKSFIDSKLFQGMSM